MTFFLLFLKLELECWWCDFKIYLSEYRNYTHWHDAYYEGNFGLLFSDFLHSQIGLQHHRNFVFAGVLRCNEPAPPIKASRVQFRHKHHDDPYENDHGMRKIDHIIHENTILKKTFSFSTVSV